MLSGDAIESLSARRCELRNVCGCIWQCARMENACAEARGQTKLTRPSVEHFHKARANAPATDSARRHRGPMEPSTPVPAVPRHRTRATWSAAPS